MQALNILLQYFWNCSSFIKINVRIVNVFVFRATNCICIPSPKVHVRL